MITDKEFLEEMLKKGLQQYKSKRQLAFAIGLPNAQTLSHWIKRGKVPGDWKPLVANKLKINWLKTDSSSDLSTQLNHDAIAFATLGIIECSKSHPEKSESVVWRTQAFILLYKAWFNSEMRNQGTATLLTLVPWED
jgi:hypothetical protein